MFNSGDEESEDMSDDSFEDDDNLDNNSAKKNDKVKVEPGTIIEHVKNNLSIPEFVINEENKKRVQKPFKYTVIVKLLGCMISLKVLEDKLQKMWARTGVITVVDMANDFFAVKFTMATDYQFALEGGPWMIFDHYLMVRTWCNGFKLWAAGVERVMVWVRFPDLPLEYFDEEILRWMGNRIGKAIRVDITTSHLSRGKFARLCVEIDMSQPILPHFILEGESYRIEYEGLHILCFECGKFGHTNVNCPLKVVNEVNSQNEEVKGNQSKEERNVSGYGPWTLVKKVRRKKPNNGVGQSQSVKGNNNEKGSSSGSRFAELNKIGEDRVPETENKNKDIIEGSEAVSVRSGVGKSPMKKVLGNSDKHNKKPVVEDNKKMYAEKYKEKGIFVHHRGTATRGGGGYSLASKYSGGRGGGYNEYVGKENQCENADGHPDVMNDSGRPPDVVENVRDADMATVVASNACVREGAAVEAVGMAVD